MLNFLYLTITCSYIQEYFVEHHSYTIAYFYFMPIISNILLNYWTWIFAVLLLTYTNYNNDGGRQESTCDQGGPACTAPDLSKTIQNKIQSHCISQYTNEKVEKKSKSLYFFLVKWMIPDTVHKSQCSIIIWYVIPVG